MAANMTMAQQRKNHLQEIKVLNNFLQDPNIGRRTGLPLNINARKGSNGFDLVDDYFPDSDSEVENVPPDEELEKSAAKESAIADETVTNEETNTQHSPPEHVTPEAAGEVEELSPDLTGSVLKSNTKDPTPQFENTKKRLMFTTAKKATVEKRASVDERKLPTKAAVSEDKENSDSDVDVIGLDTTMSNTGGTKRKAKKKGNAKEMGKQKDLQDISVRKATDDFYENDNESTFLTIGNVTRNTKNVTGVECLSLEESGNDSYAMNESAVLEGTRHKIMSPEFGTSRETLASTEKDGETEEPMRPKRRAKKPENEIRKGRKSAKAASARSVEGLEVVSPRRGRSLGVGRGRRNARARGSSAMEKNADVGKDTEVVVQEEDKGTESEEEKEHSILAEPEKPAPRARARQTKAKRNQAARKTRQKKIGEEKLVVSKEFGMKKRGKDSVVNQAVSVDIEQSAENEDRGQNVPASRELPSQDEQSSLVESGKAARKTRQTKRMQAPRRTRQTKSVAARTSVASKEETTGFKKRGERSVNQSVREDEPSRVNVPTSPEILSQESCSENEQSIAKTGETGGRRNQKRPTVSNSDGDDEERECKRGPDPVDYDLQPEEDAAMEEEEGEVKNKEKKANKKATATRGRPRKSQSNKKRGDTSVEDEQREDVEDRSESNSPETTAPSPPNEAPIPVDEGPSPVDEAPSPAEEAPGSGFARKRDSEKAPVGKGTQRGRRNKQHSATTRDGAEERQEDVKGTSENVNSESLVEERHSASDKESNQQVVKGRKRNKYFQTKSKRRAKASTNLDKAERDEDDIASPKRQKLETEKEQEQETKKPRRGRGKNKATNSLDVTEVRADDSLCVESTTTNKKAPAKTGAQKRGVVESASRRESEAALVGEDNLVSILGEPREHAQGGTPADTSLPAVPRTKSILKSAGARRRTPGSLRKTALRMAARRSGSDADDESCATFTEAPKRRISSVSFAPTPTIHGTPDETDRSSLSVGKFASFLSRNSSYQSTDASFTPGTVTSRMSSSSSSFGDASPLEESIDESQEVTLRGDLLQSESGASGSSESGLRRSKRTKVPPLEYWKNERIDYEKRRMSGWLVKGVIKNPTPPVKRRKRKNAAKRSSRQKVAKTNEALEGEPSFVDDCAEAPEEVNASALVVNPDNNELVSIDLFHTPQLLKFMSPSKQPTADGGPLIVDKYMSHAQFGAGQFVLMPGAAKGRQHVRNDTMLFYIIHGVVEVTVHNTSAVLRSGSTFFVPQGNAYDVKNCTQREARIFFTQIKG